MRRIRITLAYDGTDFHGWQVQPELPTIQSTVEAALAEILEERVIVAASGRTDAGVHALAQVAAFSLMNPIPVENLCRAVNRHLPPTIRFLDAAEVSEDFHPRYQAVAKTYEYRILRSEICAPFDARFVHHHPYPLDTVQMMELAPMLEGQHDFSVFAAADEKYESGYSTVRRIFSSRLENHGDRLIYRVRGSGFLKHMVRNIAGVLIEIGKGNIGPAGIEARLAPGSMIPAGPTAPARGLFLISVEYENLRTRN